MNSNELRHNNLIKLKGTDTVHEFRWPIHKHLMDEEQFEHYLKCIEPIPLTEEWLLKFGLLQSEPDEMDGFKCYNWIKGVFNLEIQDSGEIWFEVYSHYIHVKYVHQLQNIYHALTNTELIYENSHNEKTKK